MNIQCDGLTHADVESRYAVAEFRLWGDMKAIIAVAIAWILAASAWAGDSVNAYAGHWAVKAEGRNVMVLTLEPHSGVPALSGMLEIPVPMQWTSDTVSSMTLPAKKAALTAVDVDGNTLRLRFGDTPGAMQFRMALTGADTATLTLAGLPPGAVPTELPLFRVGADATVATDWDKGRVYRLDQPAEADNAALARLFEEDQAGRKPAGPIDLLALARADADRRQAALAMLHKGELRTGTDFFNAAFLFQHGSRAEDYLLAHAFALAALAKGRADAGWIAAATLDRYLQSKKEPQIYGTQYLNGGQDPYDRDLLTDDLRRAVNVPALQDQGAPPDIAHFQCGNVAGTAALWSNPKIRFLFIGEIHGTQQGPALFADLACAAHGSGRPVVVALEVRQDEQPAIDAFLASDGGDGARQTFLRGAHWRSKDGRSSKAYLAMFERLRLLRQAGRIAGVMAFVPLQMMREHPNASESEYNAAMADLIRKAGSLRPNALVLVLVGELHARKTPVTWGTQTIVPAAADLPAEATLSLKFTTGGESWDCEGNMDCSVHPLPGDRPIRREIRLGPGAPPGFDGVIDFGTKATASAPAASD